MIFPTRRRRRHPIAEAVVHMQAAMRLLHRHWRDRAYEPTFMDVARARAMERMLFLLAGAAGRVAERLERRFAGER
jgi:hypothetical protein